MQDILNEMDMPLLQSMLNYKKQNVYPMHTPGHKGGRGMESLLSQELGDSVYMDVSLMSELDDIHEPTTCIKKAQELAAEAYGSDVCFFAVNGTTQAIHAMLLTSLYPGDKVLLPRNAHRSVAGGLILGGINAVYLQPEYNNEFNLQMQITPEAVQKALDEDKNIKAVFLTSPNYYGIAADVKVIADICHSHNIPLLVDEAHGAHLGFNELLPSSALQCGADACAQSTHKILGAMTQCSMLHVQGKYLDLQRAADVMSILTTTSPNYLLMGSLDAARYQIHKNGFIMIKQAVDAANKLRNLCASYKGLKVLEEINCQGLRLDVTKVTVNFSAWGYTGVEVGDAMRKAGIAVELVDAENVLFLVTYADDNDDYEQALRSIDNVLQNLYENKRCNTIKKGTYKIPAAQAGLPLRDVFYQKKETILFENAENHICGEQISFYPPGIPVLLPGELISRDIIEYCKKMKKLGISVSGPADSTLKTIRVVCRK